MNNRRRNNKRSEAAKARRRLNKAIRETDKLDPEYLRRTINEYMEREREMGNNNINNNNNNNNNNRGENTEILQTETEIETETETETRIKEEIEEIEDIEVEETEEIEEPRGTEEEMEEEENKDGRHVTETDSDNETIIMEGRTVEGEEWEWSEEGEGEVEMETEAGKKMERNREKEERLKQEVEGNDIPEEVIGVITGGGTVTWSEGRERVVLEGFEGGMIILEKPAIDIRKQNRDSFRLVEIGEEEDWEYIMM